MTDGVVLRWLASFSSYMTRPILFKRLQSWQTLSPRHYSLHACRFPYRGADALQFLPPPLCKLNIFLVLKRLFFHYWCPINVKMASNNPVTFLLNRLILHVSLCTGYVQPPMKNPLAHAYSLGSGKIHWLTNKLYTCSFSLAYHHY